MEILGHNLLWMTWNIFLALTGVFWSYVLVKATPWWAKMLTLVGWILFVPNTIYLLTDLVHVPQQWLQLTDLGKILMLAQYSLLVVIGIVSFVICIKRYEVFLHDMLKSLIPKKWHAKATQLAALFLMLTNFIIAFGIVMGRVLRTNSWYVVTEPMRVLKDALVVLSSTELLVMVVLLGMVANVIYFWGRETLVKIKS